METTDTQKAVEPIPVVKKKRVVTEKMRAGLEKGLEALKQRRIQMAKEKQERELRNKELADKGLPIEPKPIKLKKEEIKVLPKLEIVEPKLRKQRNDKGMKREVKPSMAQEFETFKTTLLSTLASQKVDVPVITEKIVEKPVERIVEREKVLSGSALLDAIFFKK